MICGGRCAYFLCLNLKSILEKSHRTHDAFLPGELIFCCHLTKKKSVGDVTKMKTKKRAHGEASRIVAQRDGRRASPS